MILSFGCAHVSRVKRIGFLATAVAYMLFNRSRDRKSSQAILASVSQCFNSHSAPTICNIHDGMMDL